MVGLPSLDAFSATQRITRGTRIISIRWALLAVSFLGLSGCAVAPVFVADGFRPPLMVAVLPMENGTNDLQGPEIVRKLLIEHMPQRGYQLAASDDVDKRLKEKGFTDGGQLKRTDPVKLGEWLNVDGVLFTRLDEFSYLNLGFYSHRRVKIYARMMDTKTGVKLWEAEKDWINPHIATNEKEAKESFIVGIATQAFERMVKVPLTPEALVTVDMLLDTLPRR